MKSLVDKFKLPTTMFENKPILEMEDIMWKSKYTFVVPTNTKHTDLVTQKPWSMLYYGIIPFWDKNSYDTNNIYSEFPDFIKVSSPQELWEKIKYLDENEDEYRKLLNELYEVLRDEYFSNDFVLNKVANIIGL